jgi:CheY-like chemotaxis protein
MGMPLEEQEEDAIDRPLRVLIVEDHPDSAQSLAELMQLEGFDTRIAVNGAEAVTAAHKFLPDAVLLDIGLPVMDGYQVARELRHMPDSSTALIIAITAYGQPEDVDRSINAGIDLHMTKPVNLPLLREVLETYRNGLLG